MATLKSSLILDLVDRVTAPARGVAKAMEGMQSKIAKNNQRIAEMRGQMFEAGVVGVGLYRALASPISAAADFEKQMIAVSDVTQASSEQFEALTTQARSIGRATKFTAVQAAEAQEMLSKNSLDIQSILGGATDATIALAAATGSELSPAADLTTDVLTNFKKTVADLPSINNQVVGTLRASKFEFADYQLALSQSGAIAAGLGVSLEDFNTAIAATSTAFSSGSDAGTSFKTFIQRLNPASKKAAAIQKELGLQFYDAAGRMKSIADIAEILREATKGLSDEAKNDALSTYFGTDAIRTALMFADKGAEGIREVQAVIAKGDAEASAAKRMTGLSGSMAEFLSIVSDLNIAIGNALAPAVENAVRTIGPLVARIGEFAEKNPRLTQTIVALTAGLVGLRIAGIAARFAFFWMRGAYLSTALKGLQMLSGGMGLLGGAIGRATGRANKAKLAFSTLNQSAVKAKQNAQSAKNMISGMSGTALANANASKRMIAGMSTAATVASGSILAVSAPVLAIGAAIAAAGFMIYKYWEPISTFFEGFAESIGSALSGAATAVGNFGTEVSRALGIEGIVQPALDAVSQFGTMISEAFRAIFSNIGSFFSDFTEQASGDFRTAGQRAGDAFIAVVTFLPNKIADLFTGLASSIVSKIGPIDFFSKFVNPIGQILAWFKGLGGRILKEIGSINIGSLIGMGGEKGSLPKSNYVNPASEIPGKAVGGAVRAGNPYIVGERGPEFFVPQVGGQIITARDTAAMVRGMSQRAPQPRAMPSAGRARQGDTRQAAPIVNFNGGITIQGGSNATASQLRSEFGREASALMRSHYGDVY